MRALVILAFLAVAATSRPAPEQPTRVVLNTGATLEIPANVTDVDVRRARPNGATGPQLQQVRCLTVQPCWQWRTADRAVARWDKRAGRLLVLRGPVLVRTWSE